MKDVEDRRPVVDVMCSGRDYGRVYSRAGLKPVRVYRPLGRRNKPYPWLNETRIPAWVIYVLRKTE